MAKLLKVGDEVIWRGAWGTAHPARARVIGLTEVEPGEKYGYGVRLMLWSEVQSRAVVDLDNGYWAYGSQLEPVP